MSTRGAEFGARRIGAALSSMAIESDRIEVLHDRRIPRSRANIDHLAITPSGIYVIDAKRYAGKVEVRDRGGMFRSDARLFVGGRDRSKLIDGMGHQVDAVRSVVSPVAPIRPVLCFVDSDWGLFARPFELDGVTMTWGKALMKRLRSKGPLVPNGISDLATRLGHALRPA